MITLLIPLISVLSVHGYVLLPPVHPVHPLVTSPLQLYYLPRLLPSVPVLADETPEIKSTFEAGSEFTATPESNVTEEIDTPPSLGRSAARELNLCYFLGSDIYKSHVRCNSNWADGTNKGVLRYINELTFQTNKMMGEQNFLITWNGPYRRHDFNKKEPTNPRKDVLDLYHKPNGPQCDADVFLLFNTFDDDCETRTYGHDFGGKSRGGMCDQYKGEGYAAVVDQGYLNNAWTGPQILAHHLLLMLTSDLNDREEYRRYGYEKHCPERDSLLYPKLVSGQRIDRCVVDKLVRSGVSERECLLNR